MAERTVENFSGSVPFRPHDRHINASVRNVRPICDRKTCRCEDVDRRVDVHVVLLALHFEFVNPIHDRVCTNRPNGVLHRIVTGVGDPLAAGEELPLWAVSERVTHPTMTARYSNAERPCRFEDRLHLIAGYLSHRPDRNDQPYGREEFAICERVKRVGQVHPKAVPFEYRGEETRHLERLVAFPASSHDESRWLTRHAAQFYRAADRTVLR